MDIKGLLVPPDALLGHGRFDMEDPCIISKSVTLDTKSKSGHDINSSQNIFPVYQNPLTGGPKTFFLWGMDNRYA